MWPKSVPWHRLSFKFPIVISNLNRPNVNKIQLSIIFFIHHCVLEATTFQLSYATLPQCDDVGCLYRHVHVAKKKYSGRLLSVIAKNGVLSASKIKKFRTIPKAKFELSFSFLCIISDVDNVILWDEMCVAFIGPSVFEILLHVLPTWSCIWYIC